MLILKAAKEPKSYDHTIANLSCEFKLRVVKLSDKIITKGNIIIDSKEFKTFQVAKQ